MQRSRPPGSELACGGGLTRSSSRAGVWCFLPLSNPGRSPVALRPGALALRNANPQARRAERAPAGRSGTGPLATGPGHVLVDLVSLVPSKRTLSTSPLLARSLRRAAPPRLVLGSRRGGVHTPSCRRMHLLTPPARLRSGQTPWVLSVIPDEERCWWCQFVGKVLLGRCQRGRAPAEAEGFAGGLAGALTWRGGLPVPLAQSPQAGPVSSSTWPVLPCQVPPLAPAPP